MSFYKTGKGYRSIFSTSSSGAIGEPGPREEVSEIINDEKRGSVLIYRRMRRDDAGRPLLSGAAEGNRSSESLFKNNEGMKYLFDDYMVRGYISIDQTYHEHGKVQSYGDARTDTRAIYFEHDIIERFTGNSFDMPDAHDKIITPIYDIEGVLRSPLTIKEQYDVGSVELFRLDGRGRLEYVKVNLLSKFDKSHRL
jgi:hypothetical protein